jgi:RNA polymerase subunit RPABC4/transcription elongation factor Spt4
MISEGPTLIEALSAELQEALDEALAAAPEPEELRIAVRAGTREALAATTRRLLLLRRPPVGTFGPVETLIAPLASLSGVRAEPRAAGGRLRWECPLPGAPTTVEYPNAETSKYWLVARRLGELIAEAGGNAPSPAPETPTAGTQRSCPRCRTPVPPDGSWCPRCGLQAFDPCWGCGRPLAVGDNHCTACGLPNTEPAVVECSACGARVARGQVYCPGCGHQARRACPECERPLRRDWSYCPECGAQAAEPHALETGSPLPEAEAAVRTSPSPASVPPRQRSPLLDPTPRAAAPHPPPPPPAAPRGPTPAVHARAEEANTAGTRAYEANRLEDAVRHFRRAVELVPDNATYYLNLGVACGELDRKEEALAAYRRAVELNPSDPAPYLNMGYLHMAADHQAAAREMWEAVIRVAPDSEEAREARENLSAADDV